MMNNRDRTVRFAALAALLIGGATYGCSGGGDPPPKKDAADPGAGGTGGGLGGSGGGFGGSGGGFGGSGGGAGGSGGSGGTGGATGGTGGGTGGTGGGAGGTGGGTGGTAGRDAGGGGTGGGGAGGADARPADVGGGGMGGGGAGGGGMGGAGAFTLTVTEVDMRGDRRVFRDGQTNGTGNRSPGFEWTAHPEAKSYALSMVDMCNNGTHWVIFDIPATVTKLPPNLMRPSTAMVPEVMGAQHTRFSGSNPYGYFGPGAGSCNRYNFIVHAMRMEKLGVAPGDKNAVRTAVFSGTNRFAGTPQVQVVGNNSAGMCTGALGC
jgi:phosphatidylethanolamine-binding protein (PEBP) family uncharacterized protein